MRSFGKCTWLMPDAFWAVKDNGDYVSHEAVCVLNTGNVDADIKFTFYYEDRDPVCGFTSKCPANRTHHIRLDRIVDAEGNHIPRGIPYAILLQSSVPVVCQYSRCDTTQPELSFMGLIAY